MEKQHSNKTTCKQVKAMIQYLVYFNFRKEAIFMESDKRKLIGVRVDENTHKQMKLYTVEKGITIQDYLMELIKKDMEQHKQKASI